MKTSEKDFTNMLTQLANDGMTTEQLKASGEKYQEFSRVAVDWVGEVALKRYRSVISANASASYEEYPGDVVWKIIERLDCVLGHPEKERVKYIMTTISNMVADKGREYRRTYYVSHNVSIIPDEPFSVIGDGIGEGVTFTGPYILDEGKILFHPDSAEFADRDAAVDTLTPIAEYLILHPGEQIVLVGTTATAGTRDACAELSMARARRVMSLLVEMRAGEEQFGEIYGLDYDNPFHVNDLNADGSLNANAPANRSVVILGTSSEYVAEIAAYLRAQAHRESGLYN